MKGGRREIEKECRQGHVSFARGRETEREDALTQWGHTMYIR